MMDSISETRNLLNIGDLSRTAIEEVLELTEAFREVSARPIPKVPALRGRTVANCFFEDSTRTRLSFEMAAKRLSADVVNFTAKGSSLSKGESIRDTVRTLCAMGAQGIICRHHSPGVATRIAGWVDVPVINAGDGSHEHPTQALLDVATVVQARGPMDDLNVVIVGDIDHSRVARSNVTAFNTMGANVTLCAPPTLLPPGVSTWPAAIAHELDDVLDKADVVYMLRMQRERIEADPVLPSIREYLDRYGLTTARARRFGSDTLVMHPGPMNRGVEIASEVPDLANSLVEAQVANGVAVRMAVLYLTMAGMQ